MDKWNGTCPHCGRFDVDAHIKLFVDPDSGRILKEIVLCSMLPAVSMRPLEPLPEPGEINIDIYGDDAAVTKFLCFLAHKINKGVKIFRELTEDPNVTK